MAREIKLNSFDPRELATALGELDFEWVSRWQTLLRLFGECALSDN